MPVSRTRTTASSPSRSTVSRDLAALGRCTWPRCSAGWSRPAPAGSGRPRPAAARRGARRPAWCLRASIRGRLVSTALATTAARSTGSVRRLILPRVMRETSSRSSTSRARCCDLPLDHPRGPVARRARVVAAQPQDLHGVADGREGVAQLVGQHRQELVDLASSFLKVLTLWRR